MDGERERVRVREKREREKREGGREEGRERETFLGTRSMAGGFWAQPGDRRSQEIVKAAHLFCRLDYGTSYCNKRRRRRHMHKCICVYAFIHFGTT